MAKILVACEVSQAVTQELRTLGHEAWSCDIQASDGRPDWHIQDDVLKVLKDKSWQMVIAFPPCTDLSSVGNSQRAEKLADGRVQRAYDFFMKFTRLSVPTCIENPVGWMNSHYRPADQIIHPYMFGNPFPKRTCLWLFGLPKLIPTNMVEVHPAEWIYCKRPDGTPYKRAKWFNDTNWYKDSQKIRSKAWPGIAHDMARQWGSLLPILP